MNESERTRQNPTDKTREELLKTPWEEASNMKKEKDEQLSQEQLENEEVEKFVKELMAMPYDLSRVGQSFVTFLPRKK